MVCRGVTLGTNAVPVDDYVPVRTRTRTRTGTGLLFMLIIAPYELCRLVRQCSKFQTLITIPVVDEKDFLKWA